MCCKFKSSRLFCPSFSTAAKSGRARSAQIVWNGLGRVGWFAIYGFGVRYVRFTWRNLVRAYGQ
jgi:hypothetical protein